MKTTLLQLASHLGHALKNRNLKLVTAESCTGGGLSYWITSVPGSSDWFERGFVTYSNAAKIELLGVNPNTIEKFGAVCEQTAREMAEGALRASPANISIAVTGIAGPQGGTTEKPVGTVWIAFVSDFFPTQAQVEVFPGDREAVRNSTIEQALTKILEIIMNTS